ncbi:hypothetical protein N7495_008157 [Penicillium taxi]|uniref:uncharacterized protein n=1 Tax=Penicillium taxi TaxID=168475 RepID=UPI0025453D93|nr:uncharacterized protein N7495_008157 [Penicillium taxi]KAJ5888116.1 hypothetical protein N7495_008157 [Penicillium taxi]
MTNITLSTPDTTFTESTTHSQIIVPLAILGLTSHAFFIRYHDVDRLVGKLFLPYICVQFAFWLWLSTYDGVLHSAIFIGLANASFFASLFTSISIYRFFRHPIKSFPGPSLARLTSWWGVYKLTTGSQRYELHDDLHRQYGQIVRIGNLDAVAAFYGAGTKCGKSNTFYGLRDAKSLQLEQSIVKHRVRRPVWDKAFSAKKCLDYLPKLYHHVDLMSSCIAKAAEQGEKGVLINHWLKGFAFDTVGSLGYSKSYNCLESGKLHPAITDFEKFMAAGTTLAALPWLMRIIISLPGLPNPQQAFIDFAEETLAERKASGINSPDVLSYIFQKRKIALSYAEEIEDMIMLVLAAGDTTISALTFSMYYLAINPEIQRSLREEIKAANADVVNLKWEDIQALPLLTGVIDETLRMHPPVPSGLPRLTPPEGIYLGETYIPGNVSVSCPTWTIQRDPENFTDPHTWDPNRWINPPENHNPKAFFPFSLGPFSCVGKVFAYMEMKQALAKLVTTFEWELAPGEDGTGVLYESKDHTAMSCEALWLTMSRI